MATLNPPASRPDGAARASDPARADDSFERALLDSACGDEVPARARARVADALGLELPAAPAAPASPAGASPAPARHDFASTGNALGTDAVGVGRSQLAIAGKIALVSVAGGLAALLILARSNDVPATASAGMAPNTRAEQVPPSPPPTTASERSNASLAAAQAVVPVELAESSATRTTPLARPRAARSATPRSARPPATDGESRLLAEVARLDQARAALASADTAGALQLVERYRAEFPNGALAREAERIEARARARASGSIGRAHAIGETR